MSETMDQAPIFLAPTDQEPGDAYFEARYRHQIALAVRTGMLAKGLSIRELAAKIGTSKSQVQRLLHVERKGGLTLMTIVKAARALNSRLEFRFVPVEQSEPAHVLPFRPWVHGCANYAMRRPAIVVSSTGSAAGGA